MQQGQGLEAFFINELNGKFYGLTASAVSAVSAGQASFRLPR